jgi:hypothetical protein
MTYLSQSQINEILSLLPENTSSEDIASADNVHVFFQPDDDRFPGSFFRIPGLPEPGRTTWSLTK